MPCKRALEHLAATLDGGQSRGPSLKLRIALLERSRPVYSDFHISNRLLDSLSTTAYENQDFTRLPPPAHAASVGSRRSPVRAAMRRCPRPDHAPRTSSRSSAPDTAP